HQRSDWAREYLSDGQILYAALDAWITPHLLRQSWRENNGEDDDFNNFDRFAAEYRRDIDAEKVRAKLAKRRAREAQTLTQESSNIEDETRPDLENGDATSATTKRIPK